MSYSITSTDTVANAAETRRNIARLRLVDADDPANSGAKYPRYIPVWDKTTYPPWKEIPFVDVGSRGSQDKRHLFVAGCTHRAITPGFGEEIKGVQLSNLSKEGLDDLALLAAERGVLIFRDQDFKDIGPEAQLETVRHFGRLHVHPTMGHPPGYPEMHVVYRDPLDSTINRYTLPDEVSKVTSVGWHIDHTAEIQPPGMTFFFTLEAPESGGDTLFVSLTEAYKHLSEEFRKRLEGLLVVHDNTWLIDNSKRSGGPVRFEPTRISHPLREKILFCVSGGFCKRIYGLKQEESDYLYNFVNDLLLKSHDFQIRAHYEPGTVVVWDNRVVAHTATYDFKGDERRHNVRIAAMAEVPF